ncbi:hypothetical protein Q7P37_001737 [Cladosporium fusiforme]
MRVLMGVAAKEQSTILQSAATPPLKRKPQGNTSPFASTSAHQRLPIMSYHFTPDDAQELDFDWDELVDWAKQPTPATLGSYEAGQSGLRSEGPRQLHTHLRMLPQSLSLEPDHVHQLDGNHDMQHIDSDGLHFEEVLSADTTLPIHPAQDAQSVTIDDSLLALPDCATTQSQQRKRGEVLKCNKPGCEARTFSRHFELRRHIKNFHPVNGGSVLKHFVCSAQGCFRKQGPWTFVRSDKLTSHIKANHNRDTIFNQCPIQGCEYGPATLEALGVHVLRTHALDDAARAVLNASPCKIYRCPIWNCKKHMDVTGLSRHIEGQHTADQAWTAASDLNDDGFLINQPQGMPGFAVSAMCPICGTGCDTVELFAKHLWTHHLYLDRLNGVEHFLVWRTKVAASVHSSSRPRVKKMTPWARRRPHGFYDKPTTFECPWAICNFSVSNVRHMGGSVEKDLVESHHLSLLRPESEVVAELHPFRFQILRLYPDFITHPVFADFGPRDYF